MQNIADVADFLRTDFARLVAEHGVPGAAVAVLKDGEVIDAAAGVLSTATGVEATPDSVFQIGSITKVWTATLVMQLVDEGLVDLDAPVRDYLPDFRIADEGAASAITTRQLLSHQAGFEGDVFTDTGRGDDAIEKYVATLAELPQVFAPGELFAYNNAGYIVLGRLIEVLRETTWEAALMQHLVAPLGLTHTTPSAYEAILHRVAVGHVGPGEDGVETPAPVWALAKSNEPAGSMLAMRARDLVAFARMHIEGGAAADGTRVLAEASVRAMQDTHVDLPLVTGMGDAWGLGWEIFADRAPRIVGHDGGTIGQSSFLRVLPEAGIAVALLTNGGDVMGLFNAVVGRIVKDAAGAELHGFPLPPAEPLAVDPAPFVGAFSNSTFDMSVSVDDDGRLWMDTTPKGLAAEMGEKPQRVEIVGLAADSLIALEPAMKDMHMVYTFLGDDGSGRRKYLHYGRAMSRAD
ncbi:serine hydrolase domain-containing protein [Microbacterium sp. NPDC055357]